jgi:hypothetical protein
VHSPCGAWTVLWRSAVEGKKKREREPGVEDNVLAVDLDFDGQD